MASEVYVLGRSKYKEAWYQLTEDEKISLVHKVRKSREGVAVKRLARFAVGMDHIWVNVWPDMESVYNNLIAIGPKGLNLGRYFDSDVTLGSEASLDQGPDAFSSQDDLPLV